MQDLFQLVMKNLTVSKLVSPTLKAKTQGTGGNYDGTYGAEVDKEKKATERGTPDKVIPENSPSQEPGEKATSVIPGGGDEGVADKGHLASSSEECACEHCEGTGKMKKATSVIPGGGGDEGVADKGKLNTSPDVNAGDEQYVESEDKNKMAEDGKYDPTYKAEADEMEDESPAKKALRLMNTNVDMDKVFNRPKYGFNARLEDIEVNATGKSFSFLSLPIRFKK
jgi:hypothetical protein